MRPLYFVIVALLPSCMVGEDEAWNATPGASVGVSARGLKNCKGKASTSIPADSRYVITTFGGPGDHQAMSCGGFASGTTWYAASRQRYGCGAKLKIEANGMCAVVTALDYGPDVCVETAAGAPIIDVSPLVGKELFGEAGLGYSDQKFVTVTEVEVSTSVGTCVAGMPTEPPPTTATTCMSTALDREVDAGTCVQAEDAKWYRCDAGGGWTQRTSSSGCADAFAWCPSATLGRKVQPRTCVQAASDNKWYQCNGQTWVTPVDPAAQAGPIGACSTFNALF